MKFAAAKADAFTWREFCKQCDPPVPVTKQEDAFADTIGRWFHLADDANTGPRVKEGMIEVGLAWLARRYPRATAEFALAARKPDIEWFRILQQDVEGRWDE